MSKKRSARNAAGRGTVPMSPRAVRVPASSPWLGDGAAPRRRWRRLAVPLIALLAVLAAALYHGPGKKASEPTATAGTGPPAAKPAATFVGVAQCASCHPKETQAWRGSDHDLAMQVASAQSVLGDFSGATFAQAGSTTRFFTRDGKYFVDTEGPGGERADFEIKYTFGVRPLQQYLIELPGGRLQAFGVAWDARPREMGGQRWFHLYPNAKLKAGDPLHWTGIEQNWNFQCAECHSTDLRKRFDAASGTFHTTWSELNVACEACHGPGSAHVAWAKNGGSAAGYPNKGLAVALDERKEATWVAAAGTATARRSVPRTSARELDTCGRCHARAARFADDYRYGQPGGDAHRRALLSEGLYWPDGQMRDEVYNWASFLQSRMYAQGVTCSDCHDPHSLQLRAPGNAVCAQCHAPATFDAPGHTHHAQGSAGAACVACHMPATTYMVVDPRHDHSLRIPRPDLSVKLGVPNACNRCHAEETPQWAAAAIAQWTGGKSPAGYQRFAEALAAGTSGAPGARGMLLAVIDDPAQPAIARASALERLGAWLSPVSIPAVTRALNDPDPVVRAAAVGALADTDVDTRVRYLPRMLADPSRLVRMDAANALAGPGESGLPPDARSAFAKALDEYVAAQVYNADRPEGHVNLGNLRARRNQAEQAIADYRKAIALDPTYVPAYVNLADTYRARAADGEALKVLREGLARNPNAAALQHSLGLVLVRQQRTPEALVALGEAARLAPDNPRFAYVYAVGLHDAGQTAKAQAILDAAHQRQPYDRSVLEALALYAAEARKFDAALAYARQLRDLDPENAQYAQMVRQLAGGAAR